jgi:hypothetical protein
MLTVHGTVGQIGLCRVLEILLLIRGKTVVMRLDENSYSSYCPSHIVLREVAYGIA